MNGASIETLRMKQGRGRVRRRWAAVVVVGTAFAAVMLAMAGKSTRGASELPPVKVEALEFAFRPNDVVVKAGRVLFQVTNVGRLEHNFLIEGADQEVLGYVPVIAPKQSEQLTVTLRPGTYRIVCVVPGHEESTLKVEP